jgi:hypothetical protein
MTGSQNNKKNGATQLNDITALKRGKGVKKQKKELHAMVHKLP